MLRYVVENEPHKGLKIYFGYEPFYYLLATPHEENGVQLVEIVINFGSKNYVKLVISQEDATNLLSMLEDYDS